jgi:hypothetical protein
MFALREEVERANADTILVIHNDHFVNFDFRCYPPFALFVGQEAKGSGVIDPATIERITGATYRKYEGKESYQSAPSRTVAESLRCYGAKFRPDQCRGRVDLASIKPTLDKVRVVGPILRR